jgi:hypothetical protein
LDIVNRPAFYLKHDFSESAFGTYIAVSIVFCEPQTPAVLPPKKEPRPTNLTDVWLSPQSQYGRFEMWKISWLGRESTTDSPIVILLTLYIRERTFHEPAHKPVRDMQITKQRRTSASRRSVHSYASDLIVTVGNGRNTEMISIDVSFN